MHLTLHCPRARHASVVVVFAMLATASAKGQWCPALGPEEVPPTVSPLGIIAGPGEPGQSMIITGTVRSSDGRTPEAGVIVYAYQTNSEGRYARAPNATGLAALHGRLRAWARTGVDGRYTFKTIRPGPYPGRVEAQHIHLEVLAPRGVACEIDPVEFSDDPLLTPERRRALPGFGGSGIVTPRRARGVAGEWMATRDILLWPPARIDTMTIDVDSTIVRWTGTKFNGRGKHQGTVRAAESSLLLGGPSLVSGRILFPLSTLEVTDIPAWEPVPRARLRNHLLGPDFFEVSRFPSATLELLSAARSAPGLLRVTARLTIRDSTRAIAFDARLEQGPEAGLGATTSFRINRHLWGLSYRGSTLGNDLLDDDITFRIRLVARRRRS